MLAASLTAWLALPQAAKGFAERCQQLWSATGGASRGRCLRHVAGGASCVKSNDWYMFQYYPSGIYALCIIYNVHIYIIFIQCLVI